MGRQTIRRTAATRPRGPARRAHHDDVDPTQTELAASTTVVRASRKIGPSAPYLGRFGVAGWRDTLVHVVGPLAVGGWLYVGWRDETLALWRGATALGLETVLRTVRSSLHAVFGHLAGPVVLSLPDALWAYAFAFTVAALARPTCTWERIAWSSIPLIGGVGLELGQLVTWVPGTFDSLDLIATSIAFIAGTTLGTRREHAAPDTRSVGSP